MITPEEPSAGHSQHRRGRKKRGPASSPDLGKIAEWSTDREVHVNRKSPDEIIESLEESIQTAVENRSNEPNATADDLKQKPAVNKFKDVISSHRGYDE